MGGLLDQTESVRQPHGIYLVSASVDSNADALLLECEQNEGLMHQWSPSDAGVARLSAPPSQKGLDGAQQAAVAESSVDRFCAKFQAQLEGRLPDSSSRLCSY